ncbi:MAG: hypothetical protein MI741_01505, partial [Rhodospirillales bacterium]|nr:hypothetical protein [Rhodospirillales bacterium]
YPLLDDLFRRMIAAGPTMEAVSAHANELSRQVYDFLREHLPTAQNQRKFRRLIDFMEQRFGADFGSDAIDDGIIFEFWRSESLVGSADGVDFKTFLAAFKTFVRFRQTLENAADYQAIENPQVIGFDREAGEVDPDSIYGMVEAIDGDRNPLLALDESPISEIKFLNRRESGALSLLFECGDEAFALALSLMRCETFGKGQGQITQALRRKVEASELLSLIDGCAPETYEQKKAELEGIAAHLDRALLASLHALARNQNPEAINLVVTLRPEIDFSPLRDLLEMDDGADDNVVYLSSAHVSEKFLSVIEDADQVGEDIAGLMTDARKAFRGLSRQGFGEDTLDNADIEEGFAQGARTLIEVGGQVTAFVDLLGRTSLPESDWERQFGADKQEFSDQFAKLYGGAQ